MTLATLQELYRHELQDLYSAETQLVKALPKLAKAAKTPELKTAFTAHLAQTKEHVRRLEQLLTEMGETPGGHKCKGMAGLIKEGQDLLKQGGDAAVLDSGLITAAQKVEHYEIAGYNAARGYAQMLRQDSAVGVLQQTLNEENQTDEALGELAQATLSVASEARRLDDIDVGGDVMRGGISTAGENGALQHEPEVADEDTDTYKGATEELDNDAPRNQPNEASGPGARWEPSGQRQGDPSTGD